MIFSRLFIARIHAATVEISVELFSTGRFIVVYSLDLLRSCVHQFKSLLSDEELISKTTSPNNKLNVSTEFLVFGVGESKWNPSSGAIGGAINSY